MARRRARCKFVLDDPAASGRRTSPPARPPQTPLSRAGAKRHKFIQSTATCGVSQRRRPHHDHHGLIRISDGPQTAWRLGGEAIRDPPPAAPVLSNPGEEPRNQLPARSRARVCRGRGEAWQQLKPQCPCSSPSTAPARGSRPWCALRLGIEPSPNGGRGAAQSGPRKIPRKSSKGIVSESPAARVLRAEDAGLRARRWWLESNRSAAASTQRLPCSPRRGRRWRAGGDAPCVSDRSDGAREAFPPSRPASNC